MSVFFGVVLPSFLDAVVPTPSTLSPLFAGGEASQEQAGLEETLQPAPNRTSPADPMDRKVLRQDDFEYLGAFALPQFACKFSTAWGETGMALRRVDGKLRLLTGSHRYSGDALYEVEVPGFGKQDRKWPKAKMVKEWGTEIYQDKRRLLSKKGKEEGNTHGLNYDPETRRLYFSFASWFNIPPNNDPSLGYISLDEGKAYGPWGAAWAKAHCQKMRGGSTQIPKWFAERFTGGRTLGVGFGGYYSGVSECSWGPFLAAVRPPRKEGVELDALTLIDHPVQHIAHRNTDYTTEFSGTSNPKNGVGFWGWFDEIFGAATWIDLPDKHGMLFIATLGHGRTWYEKSDRHAERVEGWWFVYDPRDLAAVARNTKRPWDPEPASWMVNYTPRPLGGTNPVQHFRTPGCTFDATTRILFVLQPYSYKDGVEWFPLVHGWRVK